ncbi:DUF58 domain-containing protein [Brachybacterium sp. JHP9]|uniref:DUF58 domain-containing protein n=1 Tax=Brachybacterium equifaecis TaxID=2910770 RepID=A0ABT0QZM4_9MICO|nr:DUF58 domain-containing protein [Brachybacterium equifaecis]MCL6423104.1 DUF58 domain-containing protein [Brachybacterium equifaecis]
MAARSRLAPTPRGLALLVLAAALWALAGITGLAAAAAISAALLLALALAVICVLLGGVRLRLQRIIERPVLSVGDETAMSLHLDESSLLQKVPMASGEVHLRVPAQIAAPAVLPLASRTDCTLAVLRRGAHPLGPMETLLQDPFALMRLRIRQDDGAAVIGLPRAEPLAGALALGLARGEEDRAAAAGRSGELGVIPRPYVAGDDLRRIHWRASARVGTLMTREEEPAESPGAVIILDTRARPQDAARAAELHDRLVDHAASLLLALTAHGWDTRVLGAGGAQIASEPGDRDAPSQLAAQDALIALAGVRFEDRPGDPLAALHVAAEAGSIVFVLAAESDGAPSAPDGSGGGAGAAQGTAISLRPAGAGGGAIRAERFGGWRRVSAPAGASLQQILERAAGSAR